MNKLMGFVLSYIVKMDFLDGYRSYLSGAGFVLGGVGALAYQIGSKTYDNDAMVKAVAAVGTGLAILGRAGKADKMIEAAKTTATATSATALTTASPKAIATASQDVHHMGEAHVD